MQLAAALLAGGLAVAGCGNSLTLGAAATTGQGRITSASLTNQVANLTAAYQADRKKGITPQRGVTQVPQQVLTWLLTFQIVDQLARQHGISVTPADVQTQLKALDATAVQQKVSTTTYVSAAGGVPPDLLPQIGRYFAILQKFENRLDGGKAPTAQAGQTALQTRVAHAQCLAAKKLSIKVNPQYGVFNYANFQVVTTPNPLSAPGSPSASASPSAKPRLTPPC
jgi:peptidyl-prolyl cis-trans isomerase SurA